jgi:hypothetical protein
MPAEATNESLQRLGGGRWRTRDERFTIEPQSGTWVVVDAEQTDELGLALVRGPFASLQRAKDAIAHAREAEPSESPLKARSERLGHGPPEVRAEAPSEPRWMTELPPADRRRAKRLIERLTVADAPDPEGIARRDIAGDTPALASYALDRAIAALGADPDPEAIVSLLQDGGDPDFDVRWHLVDGDGRPITMNRRSSR